MTIISPLPFTLTNDTEADATQVMANLNQIVDQVNNAAIGTGNMIGPSSAVDGHVAVFDGPTGKILRDGGPMGSGQVVLLDTQTASSSSSIDFTSVLDETIYAGYQVILDNVVLSAPASLDFYGSTDNGSSWGAGLVSQKSEITLGGGTGPTYTGTFGPTYANLTTASATTLINGNIYISHGTDGGMSVKSMLGNSGGLGGSAFETTINVQAGIDAMRFIASSSNITSGDFILLGIKRT